MDTARPFSTPEACFAAFGSVGLLSDIGSCSVFSSAFFCEGTLYCRKTVPSYVLLPSLVGSYVDKTAASIAECCSSRTFGFSLPQPVLGPTASTLVTLPRGSTSTI